DELEEESRRQEPRKRIPESLAGTVESEERHREPLRGRDQDEVAEGETDLLDREERFRSRKRDARPQPEGEVERRRGRDRIADDRRPPQQRVFPRSQSGPPSG